MNNQVTKKDGWYISYLPEDNDPISLMMGAMVGIETPDDGETAIKGDDEDGYLILVGDWREAYSKCDTFEQAVEVYKANIEQRSPWSEDYHLRGKVN